MIVKRTTRYRLHAGSEAKYRQLYQLAGACRFVWNHYVALLRDEYAAYGELRRFYLTDKDGNSLRTGNGKLRYSLSCDYFQLRMNFALIRRHHYTWLNEYSSSIVKHSLKPIETTYKNFFKGNGGLPKFKGKWRIRPSFPIQFGDTAKLDGDWLHIQKIGYVRLVGDNPYPDGAPRSGTIKEENGNWYAYIVYNVEITDKPHDVSDAGVGIDRNTGNIALSDGRMFTPPDVSKKERRRIKYQRYMARQQEPCRKQGIKPSNRWKKTKKKHDRICMKIRKINDNWIHQVSRQIADDYDVVYLENLNIKGMTKSSKGTIGEPGRNVKAKSGLNKAILKVGWHKLERALSYKANVIKVPAHYTSQSCNQCGHTHKENRTTQAGFECLSCGHSDNADVNAAKNILASGIGESLNGRGDSGISPTVKRAKMHRHSELLYING